MYVFDVGRPPQKVSSVVPVRPIIFMPLTLNCTKETQISKIYYDFVCEGDIFSNSEFQKTLKAGNFRFKM